LQKENEEMSVSNGLQVGGKRPKPTNGTNDPGYSMYEETRKALETLLSLAESQIPSECVDLIKDVEFMTANTGSPYFPCPFKETEAQSALKAVEAGIAASIANVRYERQQKRKSKVDLERASCFLFSSYIVTVDGMNKHHPNIRSKLKGELQGLRLQSIRH